MVKKILRKKSAKANNDVLYSEVPDNKNLELTTSNIMSILGKNSDINSRDIYICGDRNHPATVIFVDGLIDSKAISDDIIKPLMQSSKLCEEHNEKNIIDMIAHGGVYSPSMKSRNNIDDVINDILSASCALIFDGEKVALTFETKGFEKRNITEPTTESVTKGSKDSFVESIRVNTSTIRRRIRTQRLAIEETTVGRQTLTTISIVYLDGIVNKSLVDEVKKRLDNIEIDGAIEPGFVEEYIIDSKSSVFPQIAFTERPDRLCTAILEGRVGMIIDGVPTAYIIPTTVSQFLRTPDDYAENFVVVSLIRILRYFAVLLTLLLPAFYNAVTSFHQEMIPTELAQAIAASKEWVPFPSFVEIMLMLIAFEILFEAGLRLPRNIGQAISIVGALVVGESSVNAKLVSPAVVVVVALTIISGFTLPNQDFANAIRVWRFITVIASGILGIFGITMVVIFLLYHLSSIETFGIPYLSPFVSSEGKDFGDSIIRLRLDFLKKRPYILRTPNEKRQK